MHLLARFDTPDYSAWKADFDKDTETRSQAGLTLLQLWRDLDTASTTIALFKVNDRDKAQAWLDRESGLGHSVTANFMKTA